MLDPPCPAWEGGLDSDRQWREPPTGGRRTEGKPASGEPAPQHWHRPQEGEGMRGAATYTPRDSRQGRLKDRSCWTHPHGDKGIAGCAALWSSEGQGQDTHGDTAMPRVTQRCCHTQRQRGLTITHTEGVTVACMRAHSPTITKDPVTHGHTRAHMCSTTQSSSPGPPP